MRWGRLAWVSVLQRHIPEKIKNRTKKQANMVLPLCPKMGLANIYPMLKVYDVVLRDVNSKKIFFVFEQT